MKKFHFPLERVLSFRQTEARLAVVRLAQLEDELERVTVRQKQLWSALDGARQDLATVRYTTGAELAALGHFGKATEARSRLLDQERADCRQRIRVQAAVAAERRQQARLLEKLREKKKAQWQTEFDKDIQAQAEEAYLARWISPATS